MRIALVHDYLTQFGGAERVLKVLMDMFPHAPVYTLVHDPRATAGVLDARRIRTSFLQRVPLARSRHRLFPLFMPLAVEQFDLSAYDLVISASHSFGKGVITRPDTLHVSYCFTPLRYAWDDSHRYVREFRLPAVLRSLLPLALTYVRLWDAAAAERVDAFLAISEVVAQRIRKYYGRESLLVYPPVDTDLFQPGLNVGNRFLVVSRLLPYKRIDLAVEACNRLGFPLDVVGVGPEERRLRALAGPTIRFHGFLSDAEAARLYAECAAFLFPQEEDFGITVLEAAAAGRPVVAYGRGGALETVVPDVTGVFFNTQNVDALVDGIRAASARTWDSERIRAHALQFSIPAFRKRFSEVLRSLWLSFPRKRYDFVDHLNWEEVPSPSQAVPPSPAELPQVRRVLTEAARVA